ncbi:MAG: bifunctional riboflavin kinase/FAD synthetase [Pseudomonadota bacterium]|nr:bifunctional riboflavin kinase/FAD synthetase [Pseudomonadota bacterium]
MRIYRTTRDLPEDARRAVVAMGNFDGVHRGHQAVLARAAEVAAGYGAPLAVMTFEPHPRALFAPETPPFRLTPFRTKARILQDMGVEILYVIHFDRVFSEMAAGQFVEDILVRDCAVRHVVTGGDFVFGHKRSGAGAMLQDAGQRLGFGVTLVPLTLGENSQPCSSSQVRALLQAGQPEQAAQLLGRPWLVEGLVRQGQQRGRTIGVPTANLDLGEYLRPAFGVYAVQVGLEDGRTLSGVANIGRRPTVNEGTDVRLEVHILDAGADLDLYDRHLRVGLLSFIRPEQKFEDLDALRARITQDMDQARNICHQHGL